MRRFVVGDIHGGKHALAQCFERAHFDRREDLLISLGDICDGWPEVSGVVEELLRVKNLKLILSNHDQWALRWIETGWQGDEWLSQGGQATVDSYGGDAGRVPQAHADFFRNAAPYLELDNKLFVHAGIDPRLPMPHQSQEVLLWDRTFVNSAVRNAQKDPARRYGPWDDIFVGHTTTQCYHTLEPVHAGNVWALDTGGGWSGKLTIMDIDSHEYWQSDLVPDLYPGIPGRR